MARDFNVNTTEPINPISISPSDNEKNVDRTKVIDFKIVVSRPDYAVDGLTAVIDTDAKNFDIPTLSSLESLKNGSPTGTITTSAGSLFATASVDVEVAAEMAVGDFIFFPSGNEWARISSLDGVNVGFEDPFSQTLTTETYDIYDSPFGITGGRVGALGFDVTRIEASNDNQQVPSEWQDVRFSYEALQVEKLDGQIPQHFRFTISVLVTDNTTTNLDELGDYFIYILGNMDSSEMSIVDELKV